jgi:hypothetical protein
LHVKALEERVKMLEGLLEVQLRTEAYSDSEGEDDIGTLGIDRLKVSDCVCIDVVDLIATGRRGDVRASAVRTDLCFPALARKDSSSVLQLYRPARHHTG